MVDAAEAIGKARAAVTRARRTPGHEPDGAPGRAAQAHRALRHLSRRSASSSPTSSTSGSTALSRRPLNQHRQIKLNYTHPMDALNLVPAGCAHRRSHPGLAVHPLPGVAVHRARPLPEGKPLRRAVHGGHGGLVSGRRSFGYFFVLPGALKILIVGLRHTTSTPMVTIEDYTGFFLSIILGLGISFELPILIFFLAHVRHCEPAVSVEEHPLRDSRGLPGGRHHLPQPRSLDHVHLRRSHAGALPDRHRRRLVGASLARKKGQRGRA